MKQRLCRNCGQPVPERKRKGLYCDDSTCQADRAKQRQAKTRRRQRGEPKGAPKLIEPGDPGTPEWCAFEGFTTAGLKRHGAWRYSPADEERIVALLKDAKPNAKGKSPHVPTIRRVVRDSTGGLVFPKFRAPEINPEPIPDQLDPDIAVTTDPRSKMHKHDRIISGQYKILVLVERGGELTTIPKQWVKKGDRVLGYEYSKGLAELHINRSRSADDYHPDSGKGDHRGVNIEGWHRHAPRTAKYFNVGDNKRTDFGPNGLEPWRTAKEGIGHLEGKKKHMACEAGGWPAVISWLSISMPSKREIEAHADWLRENNPSIVQFIGCDADWMDFERNRGAVFRQAMYVQSWYREAGIEAYMIAPPVAATVKCKCDPKDLLARGLSFERAVPPGTYVVKTFTAWFDTSGWCRYCGGYFKGHDEWYGAGGSTDDLIVVDRQPPYDRIADLVFSLPIHGNAKPGRARALRGLSLHGWNEALGVNLLDVPLKTMQKITGARRPQEVPQILEDLENALDISGSLELEPRPWYDENMKRRGIVLDWVRRPRIRVKPEFEPPERFVTHREFWRTRNVNATVAQLDPETKADIDYLVRREREREELERADDAARLEKLLDEGLATMESGHN